MATGVTAWIVGQARSISARSSACSRSRACRCRSSRSAERRSSSRCSGSASSRTSRARRRPTPPRHALAEPEAAGARPRIVSAIAGLRAAHRRRNRGSHLSGDRGRAGAAAARARGAVRRRQARHRRAGGACGRLRDRPVARPRTPAAVDDPERRRRSGARPRRWCVRSAIVRRYRPRVVVGFGGYASFPVCSRRGCSGCPSSFTNRTPLPASPIGSASGSARGPRSRCPTRRLPNATLTGNPVRAAFARPRASQPGAAIPRWSRCSAARRAPARSTAPRSVVTTAGATRTDLAVHHVCGPRNLDDVLRGTRRARRRGGDMLQLRARRVRGAHGCRATSAPRSRCAVRARERSRS